MIASDLALEAAPHPSGALQVDVKLVVAWSGKVRSCATAQDALPLRGNDQRTTLM